MARINSGGDVSITIDAINNAKTGIDGSINEMKRLDKKTATLTERMRRRYRKVTKSIFSIRGALVGLGAYTIGKNIFEAAAQIEEGWIGVAKTTEMAGKQLGEFKQKIRDLSTSMKGVKLKELQDISTIAGQLGIKGADNLTEFTRVVGMMRVATDLTAEAAAENFAQISNIMKVPISNVENLGSVMNELSNKTTATASDIASLTKRMGGAAKTLGLTTPEVMGLAATIKDMGIQVEVGGTAMSRVFQQMITNVDGFASASGVPLEHFAELVRNKPVEALKIFMQNLSRMDKFRVSETLENLGLSAGRVGGTILKLSGGFDVMNKNLAIANTEWAKGTSLQKEYDTASQGMNSNLAQLSNEFALLAERISEDLFPAIKWLLPKIAAVIHGFIRFGEIIGETAAKVSLFVESLFGSGQSFVDNFVQGIKSKAADSYQAVKGWLSGIRDYLPFSPAKVGPLSDLDKSGMAFATTFAEGMLTGQVAVLDAASHLGRQAKLGLTGGGRPDVPSGMPPRTGDEPMGSSGLTVNGGLSQAIGLGINKLIPLKDKELETFKKNNKEIIKSEQMRANIVGAANKGMEQQMLSLIETGKFSVGAMAQMMAQQVKIELVGLAARAAVQALYFTAMGIAGSTPWGEAIVGPGAVWFAAAKTMALISGASLAGAAATQALFGGSAQRPAPGTVGGDPLITTSAGASPVPQRIAQSRQRPTLIFQVENMQLLDEDSVDRLINRINERVDYDVILRATETV